MAPLHLSSILADICSRDTGQDVCSRKNLSESLQPWNDAIESLMLHQADPAHVELRSAASTEAVSNTVRDGLLSTIHGGFLHDQGEHALVDSFKSLSFPFSEDTLEWVKDLSIWIRTCKNLIRLYRYLLATKTIDTKLDPFLSPVRNLSSIEMTHVYVDLFHGATDIAISLSSSTGSSNMDQMNHYTISCSPLWENENRNSHIDAFCELAKQSATALFHATAVYDATNVEAKKALYSLIDDTTTTTTPCISVLLNLSIRIVSCTQLFFSSILYPVMKILQTILVTIPFEKIDAIVHNSFAHLLTSNSPMFLFLVGTMQSCLISNPPLVSTRNVLCQEYKVEPFGSGTISHTPDYRLELLIETLRVLFALECYTKRSSVVDDHAQDPTTEKLLNRILVDILLLPRSIKEQECKVASLALFMDASHDLATTLLSNDTIPEFVYILENQLEEAFSKARASMPDPGITIPIRYSSHVTGLLPILVALITLCKKNCSIQSIVREAVFPRHTEELFLDALRLHHQDVVRDSKSGQILVAKNMQPIYAHPGSLHWQLIQLMTCVQTNVKRCTNELMWIVCNNDKIEFVLRTGFGNAVQFLGALGFVNISGVYDTVDER